MKYNRQDLETNIKALELAVKMEADIREVVQKMKHYKQVNSKFTDALKAKGYHAWICKDKYSTKLNVSYNAPQLSYEQRVDFKVYESELIYKCPITWKKIESELVRHAFADRLHTAFEQMKFFEVEKVKFKELTEFMNKMEFKCFDLYQVKREMKELLDYANKN